MVCVRMVDCLRKPVLAGLVTLCALVGLATTASATDAPTRSHASGSVALRGGVDVVNLSFGAQPSEADRDIAWAQQLHAKLVRFEVPWSVMEPHLAGEVDPRALSFTDRLMSDAASAHIGVIAMVESTPCWASSAPSALLRRCSERRTSLANAWPPQQPEDYAGFVAYLAHRYSSDLAAIEVWNEPDQVNEAYFAGPEKPKRYAAILRAAYPAIKAVAPNVPVLAGSIVGSRGTFLHELYAAGIKGYYDGLAVHFYTLTLAALRSIHAVQVANGDNTPLWLNEFGWSSCWPRQRIEQEQPCVTPQVQASNLATVIRAMTRFKYVAAAIVYKLQGNPGEEFGVLRAGGARKPSFAALASAFASPSTGSTGAITLHLRRSGASVLASGLGGPGDFMRIEVLERGALRYWAFFTVDRFNRYSLRLPAALGTSGLAVRVYQYWEGPTRGARSTI
jgi:hypothetical protein